MALTKIDDRGVTYPLDLLDNEKIRFGTGNDLEIYHDGSNNYLKASSGSFFIRGSDLILEDSGGNDYITCSDGGTGGTVTLKHLGSAKLTTAASGISVTGTITSTDSANVADGHVQCLLDSGNGRLKLLNGSDAITVDIQGSAGNVNIIDNGKFQAGSSNDLQIYHDGTDSVIDNNTGDLVIRGDGDDLKLIAADDILLMTQTSEVAINCKGNGTVELYYDGTKKIETGQQYNYVYAIANGNPAGLVVRNTNTGGDYDHAELRLESKNNAAYSSLYTDKANASLRLGYNTTGTTFNVFNDGTVRGVGIKFGSDTAAANTLDDYETGTWTPNLKSNNSTVSWQAGESREGQYTKIGRMIYAQFAMHGTLSQSYSSHNQVLSGLPFTSANVNQIGVGLLQDVSGISYASGASDAYGRVNASVAECQILQKQTDGSSHSGNPTLGGGFTLRGMVIYSAF